MLYYDGIGPDFFNKVLTNLKCIIATQGKILHSQLNIRTKGSEEQNKVKDINLGSVNYGQIYKVVRMNEIIWDERKQEKTRAQIKKKTTVILEAEFV